MFNMFMNVYYFHLKATLYCVLKCGNWSDLSWAECLTSFN